MRMKTRCMEIRLERLGGLGFQIWQHRWNRRASKGGYQSSTCRCVCVLLCADRNRSWGSQQEGRSQGYEGAQFGMRTYDLLIPIAFRAAQCWCEAEQALESISRLAEMRNKREDAQAKREAETLGVLLPLVASVSLILV